jgi:hypothetical protein
MGLTAAAMCLASVPAAGEQMYAIARTDNLLLGFDSATPGTITTASFLSGLQGGERLVGIDYWGGSLYAIGSASRLYTLNPADGSATLVGALGIGLSGTSFGFDISGAGGHLVSDLDQHLSINLATGAATAATALVGDLNLTALAVAPGSGTVYAGDSAANTIGTLDTATGAYAPSGAAGIDFARINGFDISLAAPNTAYLASPAASSDPQANLYTIDLGTGAATLVGLIGLSGDNYLIEGITAVPEPSSTALIVIGFVTLVGLARFRRTAA